MQTKKKAIDRGNILEAIAKKSELTIEQIAKKAGYERPSYYKHIKNPNLSFNILERYGKALKYDFTEDFPAMPKYSLLDIPVGLSSKPSSLKEALEELEDLNYKYIEVMEKYTELLEKYNKLIEEKYR